MKAAYFHRFGAPEVLEVGERPDPVAGAGQVLIDVKAAAVNPRDWLLREGRYVFRHLVGGFPIVPGSDVAGVVAGVGEGVTDYAIGDPVFAMQSVFGRMGGYAEKIVVKAGSVAHKPAEIGYLEAAAVPCAGLTAWQALRDLIDVQPGMRIVVVGASGGVGSYAVQMARRVGAEVTAVCSARNHALVSELGASQVIDYRSAHFRDAVTAADAVFDTIGRESAGSCGEALRPGGVYVTTVPGARTAADVAVCRVARVLNRDYRRSEVILCRASGADLTGIARAMKSGELRSVIDRVYPLDQVAEAHRYSRTFRAQGKIVLAIDAGLTRDMDGAER